MGEKQTKPFQLTFNGLLKVDFQVQSLQDPLDVTVSGGVGLITFGAFGDASLHTAPLTVAARFGVRSVAVAGRFGGYSRFILRSSSW